MILFSIRCPNCGGTVIFDKDHVATFCSFCGTHLPDMTEYVKRSIDLEIEQKQHSMNIETIDKEIKKEKVKSVTSTISNTFDLIKMILIVIVVLAIFLPIILLVIKT